MTAVIRNLFWTHRLSLDEKNAILDVESDRDRYRAALEEAHAVAVAQLGDSPDLDTRSDNDQAAFDHITGILRRALK